MAKKLEELRTMLAEAESNLKFARLKGDPYATLRLSEKVELIRFDIECIELFMM